MFAADLNKIGLNKGEAEVYSCLLQFGDSSASEIAQRTNIGRTNVYEYANALMKRGLVAQYERKNKIFFRSEDPLQLRPIVDSRLREIREIDTIYSNLLPRLSDFYNKNVSRPAVSFYVGEKGYHDVMAIVYENNNDSAMYYLTQDLDNYSPPEPKYRNHLLRRQIFTNLIANKGSLGEFSKRDQRELRKTTLVESSKLPIKNDLVLFEDKIVFGSFTKESFSATLLKDANFVKMLRMLLNLVA